MSMVTTEAREVLGRLRMLLQGDGAIGKSERAALAEFIAAALEWEEGDEPDFAVFALSAAGGHLGAQVDELLVANARLRAALQELVRIRDWAALAGGGEGPLPQDVITKFAEQQIPAIDAARAALAATDPAVNARRELREVTR